MIVGLINNGLATLTREKAWAGNRFVEVDMVRITAVGRKALITEDRRSIQRAWPPRVRKRALTSEKIGE
jgi:hypothetical protein